MKKMTNSADNLKGLRFDEYGCIKISNGFWNGPYTDEPSMGGNQALISLKVNTLAKLDCSTRQRKKIQRGQGNIGGTPAMKSRFRTLRGCTQKSNYTRKERPTPVISCSEILRQHERFGRKAKEEAVQSSLSRADLVSDKTWTRL